jgi:hypothetical protein
MLRLESLGKIKTVLTKRTYTCSQHVTLQIKIGWRKVKTYWFGPAKWFWPNSLAQFARAGKSHWRRLPIRELILAVTMELEIKVTLLEWCMKFPRLGLHERSKRFIHFSIGDFQSNNFKTSVGVIRFATFFPPANSRTKHTYNTYKAMRLKSPLE